MTDKQPKNEVSKLLNKTHEQVWLAPEEKKIQFAKENAGFVGWIAASLGQLRPEHFRAMIEGKNLMVQKKKNKE